jgi:glycine/D-amino acid oxidase-like deaminating enzyme
MNRSELSELSDKSFDVIVVGAGINGAGAAQQLVSDGYRVLIIDKGDFAGGATSKSSRGTWRLGNPFGILFSIHLNSILPVTMQENR